ncbi:MAG: hypothetical protein CES88_12325 [Halobacteriovorax sp. JY17]|nr:MAG: hypothetical protein CES88_12325 [Halobacteriovorax sp. JY17]
MLSIIQRNGRPTLFTGEMSPALYLVDCLEERVDFPFLDSLERSSSDISQLRSTIDQTMRAPMRGFFCG